MFKLPGLPSPEAGTHELADFAELLCWVRGGTSEREIVAYLGRIDDNDTSAGCNDDEDENLDVLAEVMNEIERRGDACNSGYPFVLGKEGTTLTCRSSKPEATQSIVYLYLLLSTRLNMKANRTHANLDGTKLLETLSAHVLRNYLGFFKAKSMVFGTSIKGKFRDKVDDLCRFLCEGSGSRYLDDVPVHANDDRLDTVAWVPFADRSPGQLIIFAQCKTGTNWQDSTTELHPRAFIDKWMREPVLVPPVRAFCVSEAADRARWKGYSLTAGILFDRCRLVEFSGDLPEGAASELRTWTLAAKATIGLND